MVKQIAKLALSLVLLAGCSTKVSAAPATQQFSGNASWYGVPFHGRKTASGEIFDMNKLTAAHKTLGLPTKVMVENPKTGKSAIIKVNDRGPYVKTRVMDLSREGAKTLGYLDHGTAYLDFTVLPKAPKADSSSAPDKTDAPKDSSK